MDLNLDRQSRWQGTDQLTTTAPSSVSISVFTWISIELGNRQLLVMASLAINCTIVYVDNNNS